MGPMSKKARGRQMQAQSKKGKKGKGGKGKAGGAPRRPAVPGGLPNGFPGLPGGGFPGAGPGALPPGQGLPDLTKLNFDQLKGEQSGR
jgi:signal recognition particle subunit SRP54